MAVIQVGGAAPKESVDAVSEAILKIIAAPVGDSVKETALETLRAMAVPASASHPTISNNSFVLKNDASD